MPSVQRKNDANDAGGTITTGAATVRVNNQSVSIDGSSVSTHPNNKPPHVSTVTAGGIATVRAEGKPINVTGNKDQCGHSRVGGSPDVRAG
jgi:hypothetical protein